MFEGLSSGLILALIFFVLVISIVWCFLPFAIFGTKPRLEKIIEENERTNVWMQELTVEIKLLRQELANSKRPESRHISFNHGQTEDAPL